MITAEQFKPRCNCRSVGECWHGLTAEMTALDALVDAFALEMKKKLYKQYVKGYHGWDDPEMKALLETKLNEHVQRGEEQMVDVANLAAMLWNMEQGAD